MNISFYKSLVFFLQMVGMLVVFLGIQSCGSLNQNVMFRTDGMIISDTILDAVSRAEKNYTVKKDDYLEVFVYTNKGERLIDPNQEMGKQLNSGTAMATNGTHMPLTAKFLVEQSGEVKLPLIGYLKVQGYTLHQLDSVLQLKYSDYYQDAFVISKILNKRAFVLGNAGGKANMTATVIPLDNENMSVVEVLTIAGGLDELAKANNIRLIRGDLKNPNVYVIDLSTIEGVRKSHLTVQPNDIIYIERQRRALNRFLTEMMPLVAVVNTILLVFIAAKTRL
jgi:polysaccharide export outer membrane protein